MAAADLRRLDAANKAVRASTVSKVQRAFHADAAPAFHPLDARLTSLEKPAVVTLPSPVPPAAPGEPAPISGRGYRLVYDEQFGSLAGWTDRIWYDPAPAHGAVKVLNGNLVLTARRADGWRNVTATTLAKSAFTRGYFEARIRWTGGSGAWPAFWLFSDAHTRGRTPASLLCSELDVFEGQGQEPRGHNGALHRNTGDMLGAPDASNPNNWTDDVGADLTVGWHTYSALWTKSEIVWFVDGEELKRWPVWASTDQQMFLLLQMWVGGWEGGPDSSTPAELVTEVDWVRAWQRPATVSRVAGLVEG